MHAHLKDLISARDGEPLGVEIAEHLAGCAECSAALAQLSEMRAGLRRLPAFEPPGHSWAAIEQCMQSPAARPRGALGWPAATAATLLVAGMLVLLIGPVMHGRPSGADGDPAQAGNGVRTLVARSQQLEAILNHLPRPAVERAATSAAIDDLEARIEVLDMQLSNEADSRSSGAQTQALWSERVQLLNSLVGVRYAEQALRGNRWSVIATGDI